MKKVHRTICHLTTALLVLQAPLCAEGARPTPQESFLLRRIAEFWKDKDFEGVKEQITSFLAAHPDTNVADNLYAILGDIYFQEGNKSEARGSYSKIVGSEFREKTLLRYTKILYDEGKFDQVMAAASPFFTEEKAVGDQDARYLLAEALFNQMEKTQEENEKALLAKEAKRHYLALDNEQYRDYALFPLAEVRKVLGEYSEASATYLLLAEKNPDRKEELLFQAAALQLTFDKKSAIETLGRVYELNGALASEAAYEQLALLFEEKQYEEIIARSSSIRGRLAEGHENIFEFCLGKSYFGLGRAQEAIPYLERYLTTGGDQEKAALITLITCAQKTHHEALLDKSVEAFCSKYPGDSESEKALLIRAQAFIERGKGQEAACDFQRIISQFPQSSERENVMYDYALILSKIGQWERSREAFYALLSAYPTTQHEPQVWHHLVGCSIQEMKSSSGEELAKKKEVFVADLEQALKRESVFSGEEASTYQLLLAKLHMEGEHYDKALQVLDNHLARFGESSGEAHLMTALCHQELGHDPALFSTHAELALQQGGIYQNLCALHLKLFNTYLDNHDWEKAAYHLYESFVTEKGAIQFDNQLWLANYYYDQASKDAASKEKAILLFEKVLGVESETMALHIPEDKPFLETEALKLAELLPLEKRELLLRSLIQLQDQMAQGEWKFHRQAVFELGKTLAALGEMSKAIELYDHLIDTSSHAPSYFSQAALLEKVRLLYAHCKQEERSEKNPLVAKMLSELKDLQIQKRLHSEPIHLEAALDYADMRAGLAESESQVETALFYLNRVKDDFAPPQEGPPSDYHASRQSNPEKDQLYAMYMKEIEAEILALEGKIAERSQQEEKATQSKQLAEVLFQELLADKALTPYLKGRIQSRMMQ